MINKLNSIDWIAIVLVIIGGLNWGLIGFFGFDLVERILGLWPVVVRVIYALVGISAVYMIYTSTKIS